MRRLTRAILCALACAAVPAAAQDPCPRVSRAAYLTVPELFYAGNADSLYHAVLAWQDACGETEPVVRTRILAAVWDDALDEDVYDGAIIDHLVERARGFARKPAPDPAAGDPREAFDAFTMDLADQLLPHTDRGGLEEFFCLFYAGRTSEAWTLLSGEELADSDLAGWYADELDALQVPQPAQVVAATGGGWWPAGDLALVGDKPTGGVLLGLRGRHWLGRLIIESRIGPSARPYDVDTRELEGVSNSFDALLLGIELGRVLVRRSGFALDVFCGGGGDFVKPFPDEDVVLGAVVGSVGVGVRRRIGPDGSLLVGVDARHEWQTDRNPAATPLGGRAWSVRLVFGLWQDEGRDARLQALQP